MLDLISEYRKQKNNSEEVLETFRTSAHGKLLLSGEYGILNGATGLCLPSFFKQTLEVKSFKMTNSSNNKKSTVLWKSYDSKNSLWYEETILFDFEEKRNGLPKISLLSEKLSNESKFIVEIFNTILKLNPKKLVGNVAYQFKINMNFERHWGLGSSSSLLSCMSDWADIPLYFLYKNLNDYNNGSGYDLVCAKGKRPLLFHKVNEEIRWKYVYLDYSFKDSLYLVYLNKKQSTRESINHYEKLNTKLNDSFVSTLTKYSKRFGQCKSLDEFNELIIKHEKLLSEVLGKTRVKELLFSDFWGEVKSLGAWGGDFCLVTSNKSFDETSDYFIKKGHKSFFRLKDFCPLV